MKKNLINIFDYESNAKETLDSKIADFFNCGAADQITLNKNIESFKNIFLKPRILKNVTNCDITHTISNTSVSMPILIAPTGCHGLACKDAELATAKAAKDQDTIMILSMLSNFSLEDVSKNSNAKLWFQINPLSDKECTIDLIKRAENSGYKAIVITVDGQYLGLRDQDIKNNFSFPPTLKFANLENYFNETELYGHGRENLFLKSLTWNEISWIKSKTNLPIFLKGILHEEDAKIAVESGIDGIIVSNHGGRQLDTAIPTILALPKIVSVVENRVPILLDGGIRRGSDILKAIAMGADAVLIGRPILWGLSVNGLDGAKHILDIMKSELIRNMRLCGISSIKELKHVAREIIA